jgi:hypothetical protein
MAFRSSALAEIGGFDVALGAGSPCMGAEDTRAFTELLCLGGTVVYQPTAVTRHFHRRSVEELRHQMLGYGVGLTAFYTSLVLTRPRYIPDLVRLIPTAFRDLFGKDSLRSGALPPSFPSELLRANRRGTLVGPLLYVRAKFEPARRSRRRPKGSAWFPVKSQSAGALPISSAACSRNEPGDSVVAPSVVPTARQSDT